MQPAFARTVADLGGQAGERWLAGLAERIERLTIRWHLQVEDPFPALTYAFVAPATRRDGTEAVLKVAPYAWLDGDEPAALERMQGPALVRLLESAPDEDAILLERLRPGRTLADAAPNDDQATLIGAQIMRSVRCPSAQGFRHVASWAAGFTRLRAEHPGILPPEHVDRAEGLFRDLLSSSSPEFLIHGDLHHLNMLEAGEGLWKAIDPKGYLGPAECEAGPFLRNALPKTGSLRPLLNRRLSILAEELPCDRQTLTRWGYALCVLSAIWSVEDHNQGWQPALHCAEALSP